MDDSDTEKLKFWRDDEYVYHDYEFDDMQAEQTLEPAQPFALGEPSAELDLANAEPQDYDGEDELAAFCS
eukprot:9759521-Heterocapsa_arctica.AAC.1